MESSYSRYIIRRYTGNSVVWRPFTYIDYESLRKTFRTVLLNQLDKAINTGDFKKVKAYIYKNCSDGFYVFEKPTISTPKQVAKYIGRYTGRPVIAQSRITNYDGENVTFWYERHDNGEKVVEIMSAVEFIKKLIIHIPDTNFKMIRYYGIYAKKHHNSDKLFMLVSEPSRKFIFQASNWRARLLLSFGYDPLWCDCGKSMTVLEICVNETPLFENYRMYCPNTS